MNPKLQQAILLGEFDADLDAMVSAIEERKRDLNNAAILTLQPGDTVRLKATISPKYLAGLRARVVRRLPKRVLLNIVDEDKPYARRYGNGDFRCPASLIEAI